MTKEQNQKVYKLMYKYLLKILPQGVQKEDLDRYFESEHTDINSLNEVYEQFLFSAQNYQSMPNVIKFTQRKEEIKSMLFNYDFKQISELNPKDLYQQFRSAFNVNSADNNFNSWLKFSKSAITSAKFMSEFKNVEDFKTFVQQFDYNVHTRMALPLLIAHKIHGFQFALSCDCLKELGFTNYCKPDVHIIDVLEQTGISTKDPINVFESITKMAKDCNTTPYKIDKIMWLICSGNFYLNDIKITRHKQQLIELINDELTLNQIGQELKI